MPKQIMIVDNDHNILEFMQLALAFEGYDVRVSTTGRELRQVPPSQPPDLILLDVKLVDELFADLFPGSGQPALRFGRQYHCEDEPDIARPYQGTRGVIRNFAYVLAQAKKWAKGLPKKTQAPTV